MAGDGQPWRVYFQETDGGRENVEPGMQSSSPKNKIESWPKSKKKAAEASSGATKREHQANRQSGEPYSDSGTAVSSHEARGDKNDRETV